MMYCDCGFPCCEPVRSQNKPLRRLPFLVVVLRLSALALHDIEQLRQTYRNYSYLKDRR